MALVYLNEGDTTFVQGSGKNPYKIRKIGGVVDCSCPAWRNMGGNIDTRICKHIKANIDPTCLLPQAVNSTPNVTTTTSSVKTPGKKTTAPPCLLAHKWEGEDPTGWYMSEKYDGIRVWWTGEKLLSRLGNEFFAPQWFINLLPKNEVLDGELWAGRQEFQKTASIVKKFVPDSDEWQNITFLIFDAPEHKGSFKTRIKYLQEKYPTFRTNGAEGVGQIVTVEQIECRSREHLEKQLSTVLTFQGEGLMLREPNSQYESGRSRTLLKVKTFKDDEAVVVGYTDGKGKHKGRIGALVVSWNGKEFELGTGLSDEERKNPPKIGSKVTFKYTETTNGGIPKFASYLSTRDYE